MTIRNIVGALVVASLGLAAVAAEAGTIKLTGHAVEGGLLFGEAEPGSAITLAGKPVPIAADGHFVLGFDRDAPASVELVIRHPNGVADRRALAIGARQYSVQRIDGLPPAEVTPAPETMARIKAERARILAAYATRVDEPLFESGFAWPVIGPISGVFGSLRILNGQPRAPHAGVDVAAPAGTPVRAPAAGVVTLTAPDLYFTGGTVILAHGLGLSSILIHLSRIEVRTGQHVAKGDVIGLVGATGRATGPNLHWGVSWDGARIDPALLVPPMPGATTATPPGPAGGD